MTYEKRTVTNEDKALILDKLKGSSLVKAYFEEGGSTWYPNTENDNFLISGQPQYGPESFYPFYFFYEGQVYGMHGLNVNDGVRKLRILRKIEPTNINDFKSQLTQAFKATEYSSAAGKQVITNIEIIFTRVDDYGTD